MTQLKPSHIPTSRKYAIADTWAPSQVLVSLKLNVLLVGVLIIRALLFWLYIEDPVFGNPWSPKSGYSNPFQAQGSTTQLQGPCGHFKSVFLSPLFGSNEFDRWLGTLREWFGVPCCSSDVKTDPLAVSVSL